MKSALSRRRKVVPETVMVMLALCAVLIAPPAFCRKNKVTGVMPNRWALIAVKSYCIDDSKLSEGDRRVVENFVTAESKPKHLLTRLKWKFAESCSEADVDARARLEFIRLRRISISNVPTTPITSPEDPNAPLRLVLTIVDPSSGRLLYRTQSEPIDRPRQPAGMPGEPPEPLSPSVAHDAVYRVFWGLADDLKVIRIPPRE